jgi:hypothetical protein
LAKKAAHECQPKNNPSKLADSEHEKEPNGEYERYGCKGN